MKCNHDVSGHMWQECSKCGMIVRVNRKRNIIRWCILALYMFFCADRVADLGIEFFGLMDKNPYNIAHAIIGFVSIVTVIVLEKLILPYYDEKPESIECGNEGD